MHWLRPLCDDLSVEARRLVPKEEPSVPYADTAEQFIEIVKNRGIQDVPAANVITFGFERSGKIRSEIRETCGKVSGPFLESGAPILKIDEEKVNTVKVREAFNQKQEGLWV